MGKGLAGVANYVLHDKGAQSTERATMIDSNFSSSNVREMSKEFAELYKIRESMGKSEKEKPIKHVVMSLAKGERFTDNQWKDVANRWLEEMGYKTNGNANTQYLIVRHKDTEYDHIHIVTSVLKFNGNLVDDGFDKIKSKSFNHKIEREFNLTSTEKIKDKSSDSFQIEKKELSKEDKAQIKAIAGFGKQTSPIKMMSEAFANPDLAKDKFLTDNLMFVSKQEHYTTLKFKNNISVTVSNNTEAYLQTVTLKAAAGNPFIDQFKSQLINQLHVVVPSSPIPTTAPVVETATVTPVAGAEGGEAPLDQAAELLGRFQEVAQPKEEKPKEASGGASAPEPKDLTPSNFHAPQAPKINTADLEGSIIAIGSMITELENQFIGGPQLLSTMQHNKAIASQIANLRAQMQKLEIQIAQSAEGKTQDHHKAKSNISTGAVSMGSAGGKKDNKTQEQKRAEKLAKQINALTKHIKNIDEGTDDYKLASGLLNKNLDELSGLLTTMERQNNFNQVYGLNGPK